MAVVRLTHPTKESAPAYSFGKRHGGSTDEGPGPGAYESNDQFGAGGYSMKGSSRSLNRSFDTPGPGMYYNFRNSEGPSYSMSNEHRGDLYRKGGNPGPGKYDSKIDRVRDSSP